MTSRDARLAALAFNIIVWGAVIWIVLHKSGVI